MSAYVESPKPVYLYRVVLDSISGVSSTKSTSLAILNLQNGEVRQLQFVSDETLMILWRDSSKSLAFCLTTIEFYITMYRI